ncbi:MAG: transporter [Rhodospirillales bacterium]|nr:transporter [Alphaproteobacteria bacterium]USO02877.1 MAG: transporter [Rhodospirillales bacterium]
MAGLTNAASAIAPAVQGLNLATSVARTATDVLGIGSRPEELRQSALRADNNLALRQLQARQNEALAKSQEEAALDRERIAAEAAEAESRRRQALKRSVARQRARFGSSGIETGSSGSAQAVLLGLFDESEEDRSQREKLDRLRLNAIDQNLEQQRRLNVLQRTQLKARQDLEESIAGRSYGRETFLGRLFGAF